MFLLKYFARLSLGVRILLPHYRYQNVNTNAKTNKSPRWFWLAAEVATSYIANLHMPDKLSTILLKF